MLQGKIPQGKRRVRKKTNSFSLQMQGETFIACLSL